MTSCAGWLHVELGLIRDAPTGQFGSFFGTVEDGFMGAPSPLFSQVLILKEVKVLCFDTLLQVLILNVVSQGTDAVPFGG